MGIIIIILGIFGVLVSAFWGSKEINLYKKNNKLIIFKENEFNLTNSENFYCDETQLLDTEKVEETELLQHNKNI